jgi:CHAT domain-containing protein
MGGFARAFIDAGAGVFVGTLWSVGDSPARDFTEEFYKQLKAKKKLLTAVKKARQAAKVAGDATWLAYVVYGDPHAKLGG